MTARRLWVVGDSWTDPEWRAWGWADGWPTLVAQRLGLGLVNSGTGGAGYGRVNPEGDTLGVRAARGAGAGADAVIVWGSVNDWVGAQTPAAVAEDAATVYALIRAACPGGLLLVYGPQWWHTCPPPEVLALSAAVAAAAHDAGALFADPSGWFAGRRDLLDADDRGHPTPAGHAYIADRVTVDLLFALADRPPGPPPPPGDDEGWPVPLAVGGGAGTFLPGPYDPGA